MQNCVNEEFQNCLTKTNMATLTDENVTMETDGCYEKSRETFSNSGDDLTSGYTVNGQLVRYKCPLCDKVFPMPGAMKRHFRIHENELKGPLNCTEQGCQFSTPDRQIHQDHLTTKHALTLIPCTFRSCSLAFCSQGEMDQHWRNHMPFHCPDCLFVTTHAKALSAHCLEHVQQGKKVQPATTGVDGGNQSSPETGSRRPRRACKRNPAYKSSLQEEGDEEEAERKQLKKKASKQMQKDKSFSVTSNNKLPSKGHIMEGTEHMYHTHICPECHRCFKMRSHLQEHLHLHFPDPSLQCPTCKHFFTSKSKLRVHMLREAGQKVHRCHLCEYAAVERNSLRRHLVSVHDEEGADSSTEVYPCPTCGQTFRQSRALKSHMKSHRTLQDGKPLTCFQDGCPFQGSDRKQLLKHAADVHGIEAVECRHHACNAVFGSQKDMEAHRRTHLAFHCSQCDYSCSNKTLFQQHKRQGHAGDEELSCNFCPFTTFNPVEFHQHVGHFHANEKIHRCLQCSFVTAHKRVLGRHMLMHSGEKPHKCSLCDFRCRDETYLSKHMLTHSDDKNHMCSECGYVTKWKHYLNVHMRKHAGDLRYQCDQCSYRCHRTDQLNSHKLRHQAKSLIWEVCAYSCKRKYELRRHMLLKHSQGEGHQPPTFQCKYCPYHTCYRQALLNHENCKHTRTREFRCALCPYTTYSGTSLFLHKRKIHGYVPGDKEWLEKYAAKERENDAINFLQDFLPRTTQDLAKKCAKEGPVESLREQATVERVTDSVVQSGCSRETLPGLETLEMENSSVIAQEMVDQGISGDDSSANDPEQCCMLVLTTISNTECIETTFMESVTDTVIDLTHQGPKIDSQGSESPKPSASSWNDAEEEEVTEGCEDVLSDLDDNDTPLASKCQQDEAAKEIHNTETTEACKVSSGPTEPSLQNGSTETEVRLKAMRKQDRDQAEALVLEGRVEMLVVKKQDTETVYRCDHCSYVSCKQTSLKRHCRSACQARWKGLKCKACGAQFKQKRGLDTHCLRKCPALQKTRTRRVVCKPSANIPMGEESGYDDNGLNQSDQITTSDPAEFPVGDDETTRQLVDALSEQREEGNACDLANPSAEKAPDSGQQNIQRRKSEKKKGNMKVVVLVKKGNILQKKAKSKMNNTRGCTTVDGKFTCKLCSFTSSRLATLERHCSRCRGRTPSKTPAGSSQDLEAEDGNEKPQAGKEAEEDSDFGEAVEKVSKSSHRFSCPSCPFMCHQKRALDTHEKRGCLKPEEVQCQLCSFVAKSQKALTNHVLVHQRDKPSSSKLNKKDILHCEQCTFTCKQERCMTQHVALKHEGARPHQCSFCPFSTTRRYRLEAHTSLHTGLGRHSCQVCSRTFGTFSKLQQHRRRVHDKQPSHFCSLCDFSGYSLNDIGRHTQSCHTGELKHTCGQCQSRFSSEAALKQHCNRQHSSFACPQCNFTCCSQATLKTHQQSKHPQLECTLCQEAFDTQESLETHRRTHLSQQCPLCTFATRKRQLLAQHLLEEHERGPPEDNPLKCAICGFTCSHQLVLEQHARSHGATHFYKCTDCQYSTRNKQKITWHSRIHTGEKPYHCEQCSYTCADPSRLKYHMRIHQEEKKYLCPECGYKCKWMSQLKYHMTKHTGDKPYACDECEYRTNRGDSLRIHQDTQHRDTRSYICEKCGKGFKTRFLLKTHQRKHSEEKPYVCGRCEKSFRWPAGLRHHYLTHSNQQAFLCRHCPYRAKHRFQVVKHLRRHHPQLPVEQGVAKDPSFLSLSLQEARLGAPEQVGEEERREGAHRETEAEVQGRTEDDTQMEAESVTLEVKVVQTKKTETSK